MQFLFVLFALVVSTVTATHSHKPAHKKPVKPCVGCTGLDPTPVIVAIKNTHQSIIQSFSGQFKKAFADVQQKQKSILKQWQANAIKERQPIEQAEIKDIIKVAATYEKKLSALNAAREQKKIKLQKALEDYRLKLKKWLDNKKTMIGKDFEATILCLSKLFNKYENINFNDLPRFDYNA